MIGNVKQGWKEPESTEIEFVRENVMMIYKSFKRQEMAKWLYRNLQQYYPRICVIIADDSSQPLDLQGDSLQVLQLPFNSSLNFGPNKALAQVKTPYVMLMDDDLLYGFG